MKRVGLFIFCFVSAVLFFTSCNTIVNKKHRQYFYYPDKNIYFDVDKNAFLYSLDGAKSWVSVSATGQKPPEALGRSTVIYNDSTAVYTDNETHRQLYAGVLYNIVKSDTVAAATTHEASERKVVPKSKPVMAEEEPKPKKGLGKFLSKIFGKKDKK